VKRSVRFTRRCATFQALTILAALAAAGIALFTRPEWGWLAIGLVDAFIMVTFWSAKRRYRFKYIEELSPEANAMLQRYGHYFAMPFASRDFSASAATSQFAGVALGIISAISTFWWGVALAGANWFLMGAVAVGLSPAASIAVDPAARIAHDEVVAFLQSREGGT